MSLIKRMSMPLAAAGFLFSLTACETPPKDEKQAAAEANAPQECITGTRTCRRDTGHARTVAGTTGSTIKAEGGLPSNQVNREGH
jgi:hypothetical protein